jgi:ribosomal protein L21E
MSVNLKLGDRVKVTNHQHRFYNSNGTITGLVYDKSTKICKIHVRRDADNQEATVTPQDILRLHTRQEKSHIMNRHNFQKGDTVIFDMSSCAAEHVHPAYMQVYSTDKGQVLGVETDTPWVRVQFERNQSTLSSIQWCHSSALRHLNHTPDARTYVGTDQYGNKLIICTNRPHSCPGWVTSISHKGYGRGQTITVSCCVSTPKAEAMHHKWIHLLTVGPLPETLEEIGIGPNGWKDESISIYPLSSWYNRIPE